LGVKPLYYWLTPTFLAFATSVVALRQLKSVSPTPDCHWMAHYLLQMSWSDRQTGYKEIVKLPPGHCLTVAADGREHLRQWHHWRDDPPPARHREYRWVEAYRALLEEAIRCRMSSDFPLGTENSGGLDSASVTAYLAQLLGEPGERLHSFGFALCEQESEYILETSQASQITHNHIITSRVGLNDPDTLIDQGLRVLGYPEEQNNGSGHTPFYRECKLHGIRTLFSGFGGDEAVSHSGRLLRRELLDQRDYGGLWDILPGNPFRKALRMGKGIVAERRNPAFNPRWLAAWNARWQHHLLGNEVVQRLNLHVDYLEGARHDAPYRRINDFVLSLLGHPYVPTRLENCTLMAAAFGVEYRWPLLDARLVQQYLSTPGIEKVGPGGIGRYLHRRAIKGVVPQRVAWKPSKDMGYENYLRKARIRWVAQVAEDARALDADLHPLLDELIDRSKLRETIKLAESGLTTPEFTLSCRIGVGGLKWLDRWLRIA
jgi:asparagine synthase (glutamine-hydrolysing)